MCTFARATTFIKLSFFFFFFFFLSSFSKTTIIEFARVKNKNFAYEIKKRVRVDIANSSIRNFNLVAFLLFTSMTTKLLDERAIFLKNFLILTNLFTTTTTTTTTRMATTTMQRQENMQIIKIY